MNTPSSPTLEALLAEQGWIRTFAARLVRDSAEADELAHEALVIAMQKPGLVVGDVRAWMTTVLRNLAFDKRRALSSRAYHEEQVASSKRHERSVSDAVVAAESQRELVDAVLELEEPLRSAVLMRWFEGLPVREIAKSTGHSAKDVSAQLQRGYAKLRTSLASRLGDNGAWAVALLPLVKPSTLAAKSTFAASALATAAAAGLGIVGAWTALEWRNPAPEAHERGKVELAPVGRAGARPASLRNSERVAESPRTGTRSRAVAAGASSIDAPNASAAVEQETAPPTASFRGQLIDVVSGQPIRREDEPSLALRVDINAHLAAEINLADGTLLQPDSEGWVESPLLPLYVEPWATLSVVGTERVVVGIGWEPTGRRLAYVALSPAVRVAGTVVDELEMTMANIEVESVPIGGSRGVRLPLPASVGPTGRVVKYRVERTTRTDDHGRFDLGLVPTWRASIVNAEVPDGRVASVGLSNRSKTDLTLRVAVPRWREAVILGRVVDTSGAPIAAADIRFGSHELKSESDGTFKISGSTYSFDDAATRWGPLSAVLDDGRFDTVAMRRGDRGPVTLVIPSSLGTVRGRLIDMQDRPIEGATVYVLDGTPRGRLGGVHEGGGASKLGAHKTDSEGRFTMGNLLDRGYTLRVVGPEMSFVHDLAKVHAQPDELTFRVPVDTGHGPVQVQLVDLRGRPLPGLRIGLTAKTHDAPSGLSSYAPVNGMLITDKKGRFELARVPRAHGVLRLKFRGRRGLEVRYLEIASGSLPGPVEFRLDLLCNVIVRAANDELAASLRLIDVTGASVMAWPHADMVRAYDGLIKRGKAGHFPAFDVWQRATHVEVRDANGEVLRTLPLVIFPLQPNTIDI